VIWIWLALACEAPRPLPPKAQAPKPPHAQMLQSGEVQGYLVEGAGSDQGILLLVTSTDEAARSRARSLSPSTVFAVPPSVPTSAAKAYLSGITGVNTVTVLCDRPDCPGLTSEAGRPTSPARNLILGRDRPPGQ
jgi:hypothetical protein